MAHRFGKCARLENRLRFLNAICCEEVERSKETQSRLLYNFLQSPHHVAGGFACVCLAWGVSQYTEKKDEVVDELTSGDDHDYRSVDPYSA